MKISEMKAALSFLKRFHANFPRDPELSYSFFLSSKGYNIT